MTNTSRDKTGMMTGMFHDRTSAERAYQRLSEHGYTKDDINVVMSDETRRKHFSGDEDMTTELGSKAAEGAGVGSAIGGTIGAILAAVTATGTTLALPGLGLVIAGPLAAAAAGAGAGLLTGGLVGALVGWGIPEERVKHYESGIKEGGMLLGVTPRSQDDAASIERHWRDNHGTHIYRPGGDVRQEAQSAHTVVGVYDNASHVSDAVNALASAGFPQSRLKLSPEPGSTVTHEADATDNEHQSGGISSIFESLFGVEKQTHYHDAYAESVRRGSTVLTVDARSSDEAERASDIMNHYSPVDIDERTGHWKTQGWSGHDANAPRYTEDEIQRERASYPAPRQNAMAASSSTDTTGGEVRIPVVEENFSVGKREYVRGGVRIFVRIIEVPVQETVQLREEHVHVEHHRVNKPATEADIASFREGTTELHEMGEEAVVTKTARVVEEVVVGKEVTHRTEQISDTVRRSDVQIEQLDGTNTASTNPTTQTRNIRTDRDR